MPATIENETLCLFPLVVSVKVPLQTRASGPRHVDQTDAWEPLRCASPVGKVRLSSGGSFEPAVAAAAVKLARIASAQTVASTPRNVLKEMEKREEGLITKGIAPHLFEKFFRTFG